MPFDNMSILTMKSSFAFLTINRRIKSAIKQSGIRLTRM
jgi:hypothetical protein